MSGRSDETHGLYCSKHLRAVQEHLQELFEANKEVRRENEDLRARLDEAGKLHLPTEEELETAYSMAVLNNRLMPEGYYWPKYADGSPVLVGDTVGSDDDECIPIVSNIVFGEDGWGLEDEYNQTIQQGGNGDPVERPKLPDSWEKLEDDATADPFTWYSVTHVGCKGEDAETIISAWAKSLLERAKALGGA